MCKQCKLNYQKDHNKDNKKSISTYHKEWSKEHKEQRKHYNQEWVNNNRPRMNAHAAKRNSIKLNAIPNWANLVQIEAKYQLAAMFSKCSGVSHEVDHIIPLQGKNVCGLHVEYNLRVITQEANRKKGNRYVG